MARNTCEICGKDIIGFTECPHYDYKDFALELALGELTMETNEYLAALEQSPYSRYLVERETLNRNPPEEKKVSSMSNKAPVNQGSATAELDNTQSEESSGITILQRLAFLSIERDRMPTPLFLRL